MGKNNFKYFHKETKEKVEAFFYDGDFIGKGGTYVPQWAVDAIANPTGGILRFIGPDLYLCGFIGNIEKEPVAVIIPNSTYIIRNDKTGLITTMEKVTFINTYTPLIEKDTKKENINQSASSQLRKCLIDVCNPPLKGFFHGWYEMYVGEGSARVKDCMGIVELEEDGKVCTVKPTLIRFFK